MDSTKRAVAVQAVTAQKWGEVERWAAEAGPPCTECRYQKRKLIPTARGSEWKAYCGAPPAQTYRYDPVHGRTEVSIPITCASARAPGGLCGIEAHMFAAKPLPVIYLKQAGRIARNISLGITAIFVTAGLYVALF